MIIFWCGNISMNAKSMIKKLYDICTVIPVLYLTSVIKMSLMDCTSAHQKASLSLLLSFCLYLSFFLYIVLWESYFADCSISTFISLINPSVPWLYPIVPSPYSPSSSLNPSTFSSPSISLSSCFFSTIKSLSHPSHSLFHFSF